MNASEFLKECQKMVGKPDAPSDMCRDLLKCFTLACTASALDPYCQGAKMVVTALKESMEALERAASAIRAAQGEISDRNPDL